MTDKPRKITKEQLRQQIKELRAQLSSTYYFAAAHIANASDSKTMGSGVLVELTFIGGKEVCSPFVICDGFTPETIQALKAEIIKSYRIATMYTPEIKGDTHDKL